MARIFITGSSTGLGLLAAQRLGGSEHEVVLHARNAARAADARLVAPKAKAVVVGDLKTIAAGREVAAAANSLGPFDAIIHNAAIYRDALHETVDGLPSLFAVNVLAPYILTALIRVPTAAYLFELQYA